MNRYLLLLFAVAVALPAWAQEPLADGEVRRVNKRAKEIVIKHGPIPSLAMDPMTMGFAVKDPAMLELVKPGDKVKFRAEMVKKEATITKIEVVK
jgi:Cu(I)/Ag(I) efflux system protein CusF